jgi:hypothetical protein
VEAGFYWCGIAGIANGGIFDMSLLSTYLPRGMMAIGRSVIYTSTTVNYQQDTFGLVMLVGGGGSGAAIRGGDASDNKLLAQGGSAGCVVYQLIRFKAATDYVFTIPDGGVSRTPAANTATAGQSGGDATITSSALATITANGGLGGLVQKYTYASSQTETAMTLDFRTQSSGSGSETRFLSGRGGAIIGADAGMGASKGCAFATGGGAVNIFGLPWELCSGGSINCNPGTSSTGQNVAIATGGGGCSGNGGNFNLNGVTTYGGATGGGGAAGPATNYDAATPEVDGVGGDGGSVLSATLMQVDGVGLAGQYNAASPTYTLSGDGAGTGGIVHGLTAAMSGQFAGQFGGGGAAAAVGSGSAALYAGYGIIGGGGGACICDYLGSQTGAVASGAGGKGIAYIWLLTDFSKVKA